jgi:hypothetical protein
MKPKISLLSDVPNPRLTMTTFHEDREKYGGSITVPIYRTEETAKYAKYAKQESSRWKGLGFSRISRISRFKEFLRRGFGDV